MKIYKKILSLFAAAVLCLSYAPAAFGAEENTVNNLPSEIVKYAADFEDWTDEYVTSIRGSAGSNPSSHNFQTWINKIATVGKDSDKALSPVYGGTNDWRVLRFIPAPLAKTGAYHFRFDYRFGTSEDGNDSAITLDRGEYDSIKATVFDSSVLRSMGLNWYSIDIRVDVDNAGWSATAVPYDSSLPDFCENGALDSASMPTLLKFACRSSDVSKRTLDAIPLVDNFRYTEEVIFPDESVNFAASFEDWNDNNVKALYNVKPTTESNFLTWCDKIAKGKEGKGLSPVYGTAGVMAQTRRDIDFIPVPSLSEGIHHFRFDFRAGTSEDKSGTISLVNPDTLKIAATVFNSDYLIDKWQLEWYNIDITVDYDTKSWKATATAYDEAGESAEASGTFSGEPVKLSVTFTTEDTGSRTLDTIPVIDNFYFTTVNKHKKPLLLKSITSAENGNIFGPQDEISLNLNYTNRSAYKINADISVKVTASDGSAIWSTVLHEAFDKNEKRALQIKPENADKYDIYSIEASAVTTYEALPGEETEPDIYSSEFSRAWKVSKDKINDKYGTALLIYQYGWSADGGVASGLAAEAGLGWNREEVQWREIEKEKGKYEIPERALNELKKAKAAGMKNHLGLIYGNPMYTGRNAFVPVTEEQLEAYGAWCKWLARETRGLVDAFGVWNEVNHPGFNPNNITPEQYVELMKVAYNAIKAPDGNPDAIILGLESAGIDHTFNDAVFKAGAAKYMDVAAVHPYDWSGHFDTKSIINNSNKMKETMAKYGEVVPIWWTEFGFCPAYSDEDQANGIVMGYCLQECYDLAEVTYQFRMQDDLDMPNERERCWGFIRDYADETKPNAAKPSYLAISAMNNLIGSTAEPRGVLNTGTDYVFRFFNSELQKDVVVIIGEYARSKISLDLGCDSVDIYDVYGNKSGLSSSNGTYGFSVSTSPVYIAGNFKSFDYNCEEKVIYAETFERWTDADVLALRTVTPTSASEFTPWINRIAPVGKDSSRSLSPCYGNQSFIVSLNRVLNFTPIPKPQSGVYHFRFDYRAGTSEDCDEYAIKLRRNDSLNYTVFDADDLRQMGLNWYNIDIKVDFDSKKWQATAAAYDKALPVIINSGNITSYLPVCLRFDCYTSKWQRRTAETVPLVDNFCCTVENEITATLDKAFISDSAAASASDFIAGERVNIVLNCKSTFPAVKRICAAAAYYKGSTLVYADCMEDSISTDSETQAHSIYFTVPSGIPEFDSVKILCWDSLDLMKPLSEVLEFT